MRLLEHSRPRRRLFYFLLLSMLVAVLAPTVQGTTDPATVLVSDVIYRADGTPASGTIVISWSAFVSPDSKPVAAGSMGLRIGSSGALSVALVPNQGATPAGTYYKVVLQLDDGTSSTEYWSVPATGPATIAAIRTKVMAGAAAGQSVSRQYVDSSLAAKADDVVVVHRSGDEPVAGVKTFAASPLVPTPTNSMAAVNKAYVDTAVASGGGNDFVRRSGDTMTGALTLAADPQSASQAANRHYVDLQVSGITGTLGQKMNRQGDTPITLAETRYATQFPSIQDAINDAGQTGSVVIPSSYAGSDKFTNPNNVPVFDYRGGATAPFGVVNVKGFGASGDASSDDYAAIQAAINYACSKNPPPTVYFPAATYLISKPLRVSCAKFSMGGDGRYVSSIQKNFGGCPAIFFASTTGTGTNQYPPILTGPALATGAGSSMYLDGVAGHQALDLFEGNATFEWFLKGKNNFTLDFYYKPEDLSASGTQGVIMEMAGASNWDNYHQTLQIGANPQGQVWGNFDIGGTLRTVVSPAGALANNNVYHVAFTYDGSNLRLFVNGVLQATTAATGPFTYTQHEVFNVGFGGQTNFPLAGATSSPPKGWIDSIRVSAGARWTANFTRPTAKFTYDGNTLILVNFDNNIDAFVGATYQGLGTVWLANIDPQFGGGPGDVYVHDLGFGGGLWAIWNVHSTIRNVYVTNATYPIYFIENGYESALEDVEVFTGRACMAFAVAGPIEIRSPQLRACAYGLRAYGAALNVTNAWVEMNGLAWAGISLMGAGNGDGVWTFTNPVLSPEVGVGPQYQNAWEVSASDALSIVGGTTENYQAPFFTFHNGAYGVNVLGHEMHTSGDPAPPFVFQFGNSPAQPINLLLPKLVSSTGVNPALTDHPESVNQMKSSTVLGIAYSAAPIFDASLTTAFKMMLTGNVTSSSLSNVKNGDLLTFILCQDSTGGRTFTWPANVAGGGAVNPAPSQCTTQSFKYDGTTAQALSGSTPLNFPLTPSQVLSGTITGSKRVHTSSDGSQLVLTASDCGSGGGGGVTSVTASAPLASSGGSAPNIMIAEADATHDGYLSQADWATFNAKQPALGYTAENQANKGVANGYAGLDAASKVPPANLPSLPESQITNLTTDLAAKEATANKDAASGYAGLDAGSKLKTAEFPATISSATTGNAATATSLAAAPTKCSAGQATIGVDARGNAQGCFAPSGGAWGSISGTLSNQTDLQNALNLKANLSALAAVATSGSYTDLSNKPLIPNFNPLVSPYNGHGDARVVNGGLTTTASSTTVVWNGGNFKAGDVGKTIWIRDVCSADNSGWCRVSSGYYNVFISTISSVTDASHAVLANAPQLTRGSAAFGYGFDDTAAINAAATAAAPTCGQVFLPGGTFFVSNTVNIPTCVALVGSGQGVSTIYKMPIAAQGNVVQGNSNGYYADFTIDGNGNDQPSGFQEDCLNLAGTANTLQNTWVQNCTHDGYVAGGYQVFYNTESEHMGRFGYQFDSLYDAALIGIQGDRAGSACFHLKGIGQSGGTGINSYSSVYLIQSKMWWCGCTQPTYQTAESGIVNFGTNSSGVCPKYAQSNTSNGPGYGYWIEASDGFSMSTIDAQDNWADGIFIDGSLALSATGVVADGNGKASSSYPSSGIKLHNLQNSYIEAQVFDFLETATSGLGYTTRYALDMSPGGNTNNEIHVGTIASTLVTGKVNGNATNSTNAIVVDTQSYAGTGQAIVADGCASFGGGRLGSTGTPCGSSTGLVDPGANGFVVRTGAGTDTARSLAAGSTKVTITNGDGSAANPTIDINEANFSTVEKSANKDTANGYAGLDAGGKLKTTEFPATISSATTGNAATATALASAPTKCSAGQATVGIDATGNAQGCFTPSASGASTSTANTFTKQQTFSPDTDVPTIFNLPSGAAGPIASFRVNGTEKGRINADGSYSSMGGVTGMRGAPAAPPTTSAGEGGLFISNSNDRPCYAYNGGACDSLLDTTSSLDATRLTNAVPASSLPKPTTSALGGVYLDGDCVNGHVSGIDYTTGKLKCTADSGAGGGAGLSSANTFTAQNTFSPATDVPTVFNLPSQAAGPIATFRVGGVEKGRINADGTYSVTTGIPALRGTPGTPPTTAAGEVGLFGSGTGFCIAYNGGSCAPVATGTSLTNPMATVGDLIVGGASGSATRLAVNSSATPQFVKSVSGATSMAQPQFSDIGGIAALNQLPTIYYQTIRANGTVQAQEPALNFGTEFTVADNSGSSRTDVSVNAIAESKVTNLTTDLAAKEATANKGAASGYAPLDSGSKVPTANLPNLPESQITNLTTDLAAKEATANKDAASGYAGLDASSRLKTTEFPALTGDVTSSAGGVSTTIANAAVNTTKASTGLRTHSKIITSFSPAQNDLILALDEGVNITLTRVWCAVPTSSTSIAMNVDKRAEGTVGTAGTAQFTGNVTCGTSGATGTLIASPAIAAHTPVFLTFPNAPTGSPAQVFVEIEYTVDTAQ